MINKTFIEEKINLISRDLERLQDFADFTFDEIAKNAFKYAALKNFLMEIIGRGIDINHHIIAEMAEKNTEAPKDYKTTFLLLGDLSVLPKDFAQKISESAGFRNAIVHLYNNLDKQTVFRTVGEAIEQYTKYCRYILDFLEKN